MTETYYILTDNSLTLFHKGKVLATTSEHQEWEKIREAIKSEDWEKAAHMIDLTTVLEQYTHGQKQITVQKGALLYNGQIIENSLTKRILRMQREGFNIKPMINFMYNLMENPSDQARSELYTFLEKNALPITSDGHFMAYKRVTADFMDVYSKKISNHPGALVKMERHNVCADQKKTCAAGLHFASLHYLKNYSGAKLVALKINPRDVVSIPTDYNNSKGRCCQYQVISELNTALIHGKNDAWETPVVDLPILSYIIHTTEYGELYYTEDGIWDDEKTEARRFGTQAQAQAIVDMYEHLQLKVTTISTDAVE